MKNEKLTTLLENLGLTENEAKVYLASLSLGPTTVLKISKIAEIKRPTAYNLIESLKIKGLMHEEVKGFKKLFVPEPPEKLESILELRRNELAKSLPELQSLYNLKGEESSIKYYEGVAGIKSVYEKIFAETGHKEEHLIIGEQKQWQGLGEEYFMGKIRDRRVKMEIKTRFIGQDSPELRKRMKFARNFGEQIKVFPKKTNFTTNFLITPKLVLFLQFEPNVAALVVENKSIVNTQREVFEMLWGFLPGSEKS